MKQAPLTKGGGGVTDTEDEEVTCQGERFPPVPPPPTHTPVSTLCVVFLPPSIKANNRLPFVTHPNVSFGFDRRMSRSHTSVDDLTLCLSPSPSKLSLVSLYHKVVVSTYKT